MFKLQVIKLSSEDVKGILPSRKNDTHKGDYGRILLICGSVGYTGAPALAAMAALRSGAGLVYLVVPQSIYAIEAAKLLEPIVIPVGDEEGKFCADSLAKILSLLPKMDAVLIGPGLGQSDGVFTVVKTVLECYDGLVVVDADGINILSAHKYILRDRIAPTVLTPHDGEFIRIGGNLSLDRIEAAVTLAKDLDCIVLLKGYRTIITDGVNCYQNETGNPGMSVGGSGDVLAGMIVSLLGQGISPLLAAACGAWIHGASGDICAEQMGQYGMLPQDMIQILPRLLP